MYDTKLTAFGNSLFRKIHNDDPVVVKRWPHTNLNSSYEEFYAFLYPFIPVALLPWLDFDPLSQCLEQRGVPTTKYMVPVQHVRFDLGVLDGQLPRKLPQNLVAIPKTELQDVIGFVSGCVLAFPSESGGGISQMFYRVEKMSLRSPDNGNDKIAIYVFACTLAGNYHTLKPTPQGMRHCVIPDKALDWGNQSADNCRGIDGVLSALIEPIDIPLSTEGLGDDQNADDSGDGDGQDDRGAVS